MSADEFRVRALAAEALEIAPQAIRSAERIEHGLTNQNWIVRVGQRSAVVRLNSAHSSSLGIDRHSEAQVLRVAAHAGLGPRVLKCDLHEDVLITEVLPGSPWSMEYACSTVGIARLAGLLRDVHAMSISDGIARVDALSVVESYWATLDRAGLSGLAGSAEQRACAVEIGWRLRSDVRPRLCHNDVHHLNLMDDGSRVRLLDWEYAGLGDPFFDLAGVCCYHEYEAEQCEQLLQHYLGRSDPTATERLQSARWMFDYIRELWEAVRALPSTGIKGGVAANNAKNT